VRNKRHVLPYTLACDKELFHMPCSLYWRVL